MNDYLNLLGQLDGIANAALCRSVTFEEPSMLDFDGERLVRIRENALSAAQYLMPVGSSPEDVLAAASKIEAWVLRTPEPSAA